VRTDADGLLATRFAATRDSHDDSDWDDVLLRVSQEAAGARRRRPVLLVAVVLLAIAVPTLAFSASARELIGFDNAPRPDYGQAQLAVSALVPGGRVARVWVAPSTDGGECVFVTIDPAGSKRRPAQMTGGGSCTLGQEQFRGEVTWSFSRAGQRTPLIHGHVGPNLHAARVELQWHGGSQELTLNRDYFVASAPALGDPPFRQLPYDVVVYNADGRVVGRSRIPTSFLYRDWKRVQPRLHEYRVAHGCQAIVVWRCRSR
jgi:hypothetical protein